MACRRISPVWLVYLTLFAGALATVRCAAQDTIPAVQGVSLGGTNVTVPDASSKLPSLLIVGFSQKSSDESTAWGKRVYPLFPRTALKVYTMPVLQDVPKLLRGVVLHEMRKTIPQSVQPWFVPILDHEPEWKALAQFDKPDEAYVLLIDAQGKVLWRTAGPVDDGRIAELQRRLKALGI